MSEQGIYEKFDEWLGRTWWGLPEAARNMATHVNKYYFDGVYEQYVMAHAKGLRALPIHKTIGDTRQILSYEDVVKVLDNFEYFSVSTCPTDSLTLIRKKEIVDPPGNVREYGMRFMADKKAGGRLARK